MSKLLILLAIITLSGLYTCFGDGKCNEINE